MDLALLFCQTHCLSELHGLGLDLCHARQALLMLSVLLKLVYGLDGSPERYIVLQSVLRIQVGRDIGLLDESSSMGLEEE